jgi:hypothetical protein
MGAGSAVFSVDVELEPEFVCSLVVLLSSVSIKSASTQMEYPHQTPPAMMRSKNTVRIGPPPQDNFRVVYHPGRRISGDPDGPSF